MFKIAAVLKYDGLLQGNVVHFLTDRLEIFDFLSQILLQFVALCIAQHDFAATERNEPRVG